MTKKRSEPQEWMREAAREINETPMTWKSREHLTEQCAAIIARHAPATTGTELVQALESAKITFFYVRNLAHDAWRYPDHLQAVCKRIESYGQMQYDLLKALLERGAVSPAPEKEK